MVPPSDPHIPLTEPKPSHPFLWRVAAPSLAVSLVLLAIVLLSAVTLHQSQSGARRALQNALDATKSSEELEKAVRELRHQLAHYAATGDESAIRQAAGLQETAREYLVEIERLHSSDEPRILITELRRYTGIVREGLDELSQELSKAQEPAFADHLVQDVLDPKLLHRTRVQRELTEQMLSNALIANQDLTQRAGWLLMTLGLLGAFSGILAGFGLARGLRSELVQLSLPIRTAAGSLEEVVGPIRVSSTGEMAELEASLHHLAERVSSVVLRLHAAERESLRNDQLAALGQLAAGLAHELRNPLTAMKTLVEAARIDGQPPQLDSEDLNVLEEEITRLNTTLQTFLDYARPPDLERRPIDIREIVERTLQLLKPRAEQQSIRLEYDRPTEPLVLNADPERMRQVLLNLILNAFDALGSGGTVTVSTRDTSRTAEGDVLSGDAERWIVLEVRDDGPGIPDEFLPRLFEPFFSSKPSGSGLGLTISRRIIEEHGGTLQASNRAEDSGAVFRISLPVSDPAAEEVSLPVDPTFVEV